MITDITTIPAQDVSGAGNLLMFEEATVFDVAGIISKFDDRYQLETWIKDCERTNGVTDEIMEVIRQGVAFVDQQLENDPEHQKDLLLAQANALLADSVATGKVDSERFGVWLASYVKWCGGGD